MLGRRLEQANKKAEKRWKYFHLETFSEWLKTGISRFSTMQGFPVVGQYRKMKGCECRGCSIGRQREKNARKKALRREAKNIPV